MSLSQEKQTETIKFIDKIVEPRIKRLIDEVNRMLEPKGVVLGVELQWFIDSTVKEEKHGT